MTANAAYSPHSYGSSFAKKSSLAWQKADGMNTVAGVPKGCVVRNTFLEWQECEMESTKGGRNGTRTDEIKPPVLLYPEPDARSLR